MGTDDFETPFGGTNAEMQLGISVGRATKNNAGWSLYMNAGYKGTRVRDVLRLNKYPPSSARYWSEMGPGKERLCSSSRFSQTMMMSVSPLNSNEDCPTGWTHIGYGIFPREASVTYKACAR
jgi:hypothetical protein